MLRYLMYLYGNPLHVKSVSGRDATLSIITYIYICFFRSSDSHLVATTKDLTAIVLDTVCVQIIPHIF